MAPIHAAAKVNIKSGPSNGFRRLCARTKYGITGSRFRQTFGKLVTITNGGREGRAVRDETPKGDRWRYLPRLFLGITHRT